MTYIIKLVSICFLLSLLACGNDDGTLHSSDLRDRNSRTLDATPQEKIRPITVSVNDDGTVALNNRLKANWNGLGFVGSTSFDIVPVN